MQFQRDEFLLLTRSGHVPAPIHPPKHRYWHGTPLAQTPYRSRRERLAPLLAWLPTLASQPEGQLDIHEYLELEFTVDERR